MKHFIIRTSFLLLALGSDLALAQGTPQVTPASAYPMAPAPGLFPALGGQQGIRALMDDFAQRLRADARIGHRFKDSNLTHLAKQLTDQICQLAGGPCTYQGPDMKDAHAEMGINASEFNALVEVLQTTMDAHRIPFGRQNQLLALLAPQHRDMVRAAR